MVEKIEVTELAVIFKRKYVKGEEVLTPFKVAKGMYDADDAVFVETNGNSYHHILDMISGNSYALRMSVGELLVKYPNKTFNEIKDMYFQDIKKYNYYYAIDQNSIPGLARENKETGEISYIKDKDWNEFQAIFNEFSELMLDDEETELSQILQNSEEGLKMPKKAILKPKKEKDKIMNTKEIYTELTSKIIGQDDAIKKILGTIWFNYTNKNTNKVQNIFVNGPTGVGKTEIFRLISDMLELPCVIEDCNEFTMEGYIGRSTKEILSDLITKANGDLDKASKGIIVLDEIDKLASVSTTSENVSTTGVQDALLKLIEDGEYQIKVNGKSSPFNTSKVTVAALGAFSNIENIKNFSVGFGNNFSEGKIEYANITLQDIEKYGMKAELLGRFNSLVQLNALNEDDLFKIIKYSKISPLNEVIDFYKQHNIDLLYDDEVLKLIALKAKQLGKGARGITTVLSAMLSDAQLEVSFNSNNYSALELYPETVTNNKKYTLRRR